jgi:hypothetical protein
MTTWPVRVALEIVRTWTRVYTWRLPHAERDRRRAEVDSDLWESVRDAPTARLLALQIITRLALGIADDVGWRTDQTEIATAGRQAIAVSVLAALLLMCTWVSMGRRMEPPRPPTPPDAPWRHVLRKAPPPPPPPPPPCNPPGIGRVAFSPCTPYR